MTNNSLKKTLLPRYMLRKLSYWSNPGVENAFLFGVNMFLNVSICSSLQFLFFSSIIATISHATRHRQQCVTLMTHLHTLLQETDDEDEESCYIKERLLAFLRWLQGLHWFQRLRNKRQQTRALPNLWTYLYSAFLFYSASELD